MALSDLTTGEQAELDRSLRAAEIRSRIEFSIWIGAVEGDLRTHAEGLHAQLVAPQRSTLFMIEPNRRAIEVVTGAKVRARVSDEVVAEGIARMSSDLADGNLLAALQRGMDEIADAAN